MDWIAILGLLGFLGANFLAALSGALFPPGEWYRGLAKPAWNPPDWAFGPAWTVLYVMIAVSGWLVWRKAGFAGAAVPLAAYGVQLLLNAAWSAIFFGMRRPDLAFYELVVFWVAILVTIVLFWPVHRTAALLLLPYLAWVSFAGALNLTLWRMNPLRG
ncbi:tryptophan-rich sensory protein [Roseomonas alkaliterrae]|uniref:Tryptophan-rich sensory protein n=1 Tax=Neoroseomonas alkaliterrae TaxID=1452450 RepID=A0A840XRZ4_9PROT|nr:TspO/MBR family protein [Neoroseomonas alkaliterrae]MBB5689720.1 tryptophan-rich sensory protein [Neoroseomonas alkaliterrae]MBR0678197.1 tryptophan-rich sensory protein [Neoroseomonas alkaliterrae]